MNNIQAKKVLEKIFTSTDQKINDNKCVLIDGNWGVGKTYVIEDFFNANKEKYEFIYVSVFGKNSTKDIEKSLLLNSIPGIKKYSNNKLSKVTLNFLKGMSDKYLGVNIENYINSFSIEDIINNQSDNKVRIICFDDLERKSDEILIKELLGLVERASKKFNVIMICNSDELDEESKQIFLKYKEKIIDYFIEVNEVDRNTLYNIIEKIGIENREMIVNVYLSDNIAFGKSFKGETYLNENISNLRIFIKYVELINDVKELFDNFKINEEIVKICKDVVYHYYFPTKEYKNRISKFDILNVQRAINKIFLKEPIEKDEFNEYFIANSEIRKDLMKIRCADRLSEDDFIKKIEKFNYKIEQKDLKYFLKQSNAISLFDYLVELKVNYKNTVADILTRDNVKKLIEICVDLYDVESELCYTKFNSCDWNNYDKYGNEVKCNKYTVKFIESINSKSEEKSKKYIQNRYNEAKSNKDYDQLLELLQYRKIEELKEFEEIFDFYFEKHVVQYSDDIEEKLNKLINKTDSDIIGDFFVKRKANENRLTVIKKYEKLDFDLEMKMYYEDQAQWQEENEQYEELFLEV